MAINKLGSGGFNHLGTPLGGVPVAPAGYQFLQTSDGQYVLDAQSNYILVRV
jgi:hypothetical protein